MNVFFLPQSAKELKKGKKSAKECERGKNAFFGGYILPTEMEKSAKILLGVSAVIATGLLFLKGKSLVNFADKLKITPKIDGGVKRISFKSSALNIPVAVDFENNTDQEVTVAVSNVNLLYNGKEVGSLKPNTQSVLIKKNATSTLQNIIVQIPLTNLLSVAGSIITSLITSQDYNKIVNNISADITCIINNSLVYSFTEKFGDTNDVAVSGLGLVAKKVRKLKSFKDYEHLIPAKSELKYRDLVVVPNGEVEETVALMHKVAKEYASDTAILAKALKKDNLKDTLQNIFNFVYHYIQYKQDNRFIEQVRTPLRTLWDRQGDCDCFATLIGSILHNLNIPFKFRIAAYDGKKNYQHVYVIVPYVDGYYVCDPVLDTCFDEKQPSKYKDFEI